MAEQQQQQQEQQEEQKPLVNNNSVNSSPSKKQKQTPVDQAKLQRLLQMDDELQLLQQRKKELERTTAQLEVQLNNMEKKYLEQTPNGNISTGFGNYITAFVGETSGRRSGVLNIFGGSGSGAGGSLIHSVQDSDCILSNSSVSLRKSIQLVQDLETSSRLSAASAMTMYAPRRKKSIVKLSLVNS